MLSLWITAFVVFGAFLLTQKLRATWQKAGALGAAMLTIVALAGRPLDGLSTNRIHFVYDLDEPNAVAPGPDLLPRSVVAVRERLSGLGRTAVEVTPSNGQLHVQAAISNEEDALALKKALAVVGRLEFVAVADDLDVFANLDPAAGNEEGIRITMENVPLGPGRTSLSHYAQVIRREGESMEQAKKRLMAWLRAQGLLGDRRLGVEKSLEYDPDEATWREIGWRTFFLEKEAILTGADVVDARAQPDMNDMALGGWVVALTFSAAGGAAFEEATARLVKRRFAIVLDGEVVSAPIVQTRIAGGRAVITMGAGPPVEQAQNAKNLEAVLRAGALPAPLLLADERLVAPPLSEAIFRALLGAVGLGVLALVVLAFVLLFQKAGGPVVSSSEG